MNWREKAAFGLIRMEKIDANGIEYTVRVYSDRIAIQSKTNDPISWGTLQLVKSKVLGEVFAVEVFPAIESDVVNLRNTRHLWFGSEIDKIQSILIHPEFSKD